MTYGDGAGRIDLDDLLKFHRAHGKLATVTGVLPFSQFGLIESEGDRVRHHARPQILCYNPRRMIFGVDFGRRTKIIF